jgi:phosphoglycolate phosphatase-like HAD superfamily hydrolase
VKILLFDIDGTLVRAGGAGRKALNRAALRLYGKKNVCDEFNLAGQTDLANFKVAYEKSTGLRANRLALDRLHREYLKYLPYYVRVAIKRNSYVLPRGIKILIRRLSREKGVLLGLGTGNIERGARLKLEPSGFNPYFSFGGFGSDSFHRPALLKKAVQRARRFTKEPILPSDVYVIGDTPLDISAGKKMGYKTVAMGTGFSSWESLVESRPDHMARDFRGISKWLKWFGIRS